MVLLILGGSDKGSDFSILRDEIDRAARVVFTIGQSAETIERALAGLGRPDVRPVGTLERAVEEAAGLASAGRDRAPVFPRARPSTKSAILKSGARNSRRWSTRSGRPSRPCGGAMARKLASDRILFAAFVALALRFGCVMDLQRVGAFRWPRGPGGKPGYRYLLQTVRAPLRSGSAPGVRRFGEPMRHSSAGRGSFTEASGSVSSFVSLVLFRPPINAARRWLVLWGKFTLQPAEFLKVALVLFLAYQDRSEAGSSRRFPAGDPTDRFLSWRSRPRSRAGGALTSARRPHM